MQIEQDGKTIEVFTPEEVQAQQAQAIEAATSTLKTELEQAKADLSKSSDKDYNFTQLRTRVEQAEQKINTAKEDALKEFETTQSTNTANTLIKKLADGDEELEKKIRLRFNRLGDEVKTPEEIAKKVRDAWALSRNDVAPDPMSDAFSSGGAAPVMPPRPNLQKPPLSENQANFLRMYAGMSDEEIKKYNDAAQPVRFEKPDANGNFGKVVV
jgi:hypothetical protein